VEDGEDCVYGIYLREQGKGAAGRVKANAAGVICIEQKVRSAAAA
jgi:hypothetical protein